MLLDVLYDDVRDLTWLIMSGTGLHIRCASATLLWLLAVLAFFCPI